MQHYPGNDFISNVLSISNIKQMKEIGRECWLIMYHKNIFVNNDLSSSLSLRCNKNKSMILQFAIIIRIGIRNIYNVVIL